MPAFRELRISAKLLLAVLLLATGLGLYCVLQLQRLHQTSTELATRWMPSSRIVLDIRAALAGYRVNELQHAISQADGDKARLAQSMKGLWQRIEDGHASYARFARTAQEQQAWRELGQLLALYAEEQRRTLPWSRSLHTAEAKKALQGPSLQISLSLHELVERMVQANQEGASQARQRASALREDLRLWILGLLACSVALCLALGLALGFGFGFARATTRPLEQTASQARTAGLEQIHQAISPADQATPQNAARTGPANTAPPTLQEQAYGLQQAVSVFKQEQGVELAALPASPAMPLARMVRTRAEPRPGQWDMF